MRKLNVGIIGCGNISGVYFKNGKGFSSTDVLACADLMPERAQAKAAEFGVPKSCSVDELLADSTVEVVVNLTIPKAHAPVSIQAIRAGKHVYAEKPLATNRADGRQVVEEARSRGLRVGCAPDTFLGAGIQSCRKAIDGGMIGKPVACAAFMLCHGHETWHPDPEFYYKVGGGPMFDMGPYYLTALVSLLGPIKRVTGSATVTFPERTITSQPKHGTVITVDTPTHIAGVMDFASGAVGTIVQSFDVHSHNLPCLEIYGTEGTLSVPDPNGFGGTARVRRAGDLEWREIPYSHGWAENGRGLGVADMAAAIQTGRPHRASGDLAYHVLDVMEGFLDASRTGRHYDVPSSVDRPAPMPTGQKGYDVFDELGALQ